MQPTLQIQWSDDRGRTWSNTRIIELGETGDYTKRVIARRMGMGRNRIFRVRCTSDKPIVIVEATLE